MDFEIWFKHGTAPYSRKELEDLFSSAFDHPPVILCENQKEKDILEGFQLIFGGELDIRIIGPERSVNPWSYNRSYLFYTFNPLERF